MPATVPGCVHTDLLAAGLIPDPYLDDNEGRVSWIGRTDWRYQTSFEWRPDVSGDQVDLVCAGLDTVATVAVNGEVVARTANMHRSYRFGVAHLLQPGENTLSVEFTSAYRYAEQLRDRLGDRPTAYEPEPFNFIRKNACNFGWDWGPTLVTAGIWRPIGLATWRTARLAQVRPQVTVDQSEGRVDLFVEVARAAADADAPLTLTATVGDARGHVSLASGEKHATITVTVPAGPMKPRVTGTNRAAGGVGPAQRRRGGAGPVVARGGLPLGAARHHPDEHGTFTWWSTTCRSPSRVQLVTTTSSLGWIETAAARLDQPARPVTRADLGRRHH